MIKKLLIGMLVVFFSLGFGKFVNADDIGGFISIDNVEMKAGAVVNLSSLVKSPIVIAESVAPVITKVELYNLNDLDNPVTEFMIDDEVYLAVYVTDPDLDCAYLTLAQYHPNDAVVPYWPPETFDLPYVDAVSVMYYAPCIVVGPAGSWRAEFQVKDYSENLSNVFTVYVIVHEKKKKGGGGGGGGGCFVSMLHKSKHWK
jgi:hypothetical protein